MNCSGLNDIDDLQFIPVNDKKVPTVKNWQTSIQKYDLSNVAGVGLVCGTPSGNVQAVDCDLKWDITGKLMDNYKKLIHHSDPSLLAKLVVQRTRNKGIHFIFRCNAIEGNQKLANRHTTSQEKKETYDAAYKAELAKGSDNEKAKAVAQKSSDNDKVRVLIETREAGGQIVVAPSEGYEFTFGDLCSIVEITPEQREILHSCARQLNEVMEEVIVPKAQIPKTKTKGLSPFEDYNERGDVETLLQNNGWKLVSRKGQKTHFLRPGQSSAQTSGNYDHAKKWFSVFTTSSEFEPQKSYMPYAVFCVLECGGDYSLASKKLFDLGYGEREEAAAPKKEYQSTRAIQSRVNADDEDYSFLATPQDYDGYLQQVIDGTLPMGLTTGSPTLDAHFLFKQAELVMTNGHDNTGKSVFTWWLLMIAAMYHGWKGIIFSSENTLGAFMRKMIQFYWGKPLTGTYAMSNQEYKIAKAFVEKHFILIKAQEDLFNYKDILNMVKKARKIHPDLRYGMIDPYNSLKIDLSGFSKLSTHEYHYEAVSEIKSFGQQNNFGWFINHHAVTAALRAKDGEKKYPVAPQKADTEGGGKFSNKADSFLTIHRVTQHPTEWMVTELHVRKIKDTETGGRVSPIDNPVKFEMYKNGTAFIEWLEDGGRRVDPIHDWHQNKQPKQVTITPVITSPTRTTWLPYKNDDGEELTF